MLVERDFAKDLFSDSWIRVRRDDLSPHKHFIKQRRITLTKQLTLSANTVFPPLSTHCVTAPPAPSPNEPISTILPSRLAAFHPASSKSSTSSALPFSKLSFSKSGNKPRLFSRSIAAPPGLPLPPPPPPPPLPPADPLMADNGSFAVMKLRAEMDEVAEVG